MLARLINEPEGGLRLENSGGVRSTRMSDNVASAAIFPALSRPLRDTEYVIASFILASKDHPNYTSQHQDSLLIEIRYYQYY